MVTVRVLRPFYVAGHAAEVGEIVGVALHDARWLGGENY
jgi:hypothetical protein